MPTFENLLNARLGSLSDAVDDWTETVKKLEKLEEQATKGMLKKAGKADWEGENAGVTLPFVRKTAKEFGDALKEAESKSWTRNDEFGYGIVRPRVALTDPGAPGPANEHPLPDLTAAASAAPSAETSPSAGADETKPAVADLSDDEGGKPPWLALGTAAAALLAGAVALLVALRARRRCSTPVPAAPPYPPSYGPPPGTGPGQGRQH